MFLEIITIGSLAWMLGQYIYHRITAEDEKPDPREIGHPITDEGAPIPKLFGRYRVSAAVLAWNGPVIYDERATNVFDLRANQFFVLGSGFRHGDGISAPIARNRIHAIWAGDQKLSNTTGLSALEGNGSFETTPQVSLVKSDYSVVGNVEFLNGGPAQVLVNSGATTTAGTKMLADYPHGSSLSENVIPGYRGVLGVCLFQDAVAGGFNHGRVNSLPPYHFEASSYGTNHAQLGTYARVGDDSNPVNVIYEILTAPDLLGLPESWIDMSNFQAVQYTLHTETHGYSRWFSQRTTASEMLNDVLRQIDGLIYFDQRTAKIKIRLIRADYDPATLPVIDKTNCDKLKNFSMGGRTNLINKVRVTYPNRDKDYNEDSATAQNAANAVGQDGQVAEEPLQYLGCCRPNLAKAIAERELDVRSRPIVKCSAIVSRAFLRTVPGDVVKVVWKNPDIAGAVFRVVGVERGTLEDGAIRLDLVLDASYVWRNETPIDPGIGGLDSPPINNNG